MINVCLGMAQGEILSVRPYEPLGAEPEAFTAVGAHEIEEDDGEGDIVEEPSVASGAGS